MSVQEPHQCIQDDSYRWCSFQLGSLSNPKCVVHHHMEYDVDFPPCCHDCGWERNTLEDQFSVWEYGSHCCCKSSDAKFESKFESKSLDSVLDTGIVVSGGLRMNGKMNEKMPESLLVNDTLWLMKIERFRKQLMKS